MNDAPGGEPTPQLRHLLPTDSGRVIVLTRPPSPPTAEAPSGAAPKLTGKFTTNGITLTRPSGARLRSAYPLLRAQLNDPAVVHQLLEETATDTELQLVKHAQLGPSRPASIRSNAIALLESRAHLLELYLRVYTQPDPVVRRLALNVVTSGFTGLPTQLDAVLAAATTNQPT